MIALSELGQFVPVLPFAMPVAARRRLVGPASTWMLENETAFLCWLSDRTSGDLLEIGCRDGQTTRRLALHNLAKVIHALDFTGEPTMCAEQLYEKVGEIAEHARRLPNVRVHDVNSRLLDYRRFGRPISMILIDGDHSYEGVRADSELAFAYLEGRDDASIAWHDYGHVPGRADWIGVDRYLNEIGKTRTIRVVSGTNLAFWHRSWMPSDLD